MFYFRILYLFYRGEFSVVQQVAAQSSGQIVQQPAAQLQPFDNEQYAFFAFVPWAHHQIILDKCKNFNQAIFYLQKTVQNNWSRHALREQMSQNLYERQGKAIHNFERTPVTFQTNDLNHNSLPGLRN